MITMEIKNLFFDRKAVIDATTKAERGVLSKAGAFIRTRARTSIRKRKKASAPGTPPSSHTGDLRNKIFFGYDPATRSVVIGPVNYKKGDAPSLNEFGGTAKRVDRKTGKKYIAHYPARPYMAPALAKEAPNLPKHWQNAVRSA